MGPLKGLRILEMGGIGPGPFCGMMLSDMGAEIIRLDRKERFNITGAGHTFDILTRNRRSIIVDLKKPEGIEAVLKLVEKTDGLFEGFRPGVMERLGLGPDTCLARNPSLVYGRMTGWGQDGPLSRAAGHDINYIALTGALHAIGRSGQGPVPPLNLLGDYGGGGMLLAFGMVCALFEAQKSGQGQVVDAAMIDGSAALMAVFYGLHAAGLWTDHRGVNLLDGGAHFYDTYETADGKYVSIGSIEPQFYALLLKHAGIDDPDFKAQMNARKWPELKARLASIIKQKSRDEWTRIMEGTDVCFAPVLSIEEAPLHPHNVQRRTFVEIDGLTQPSPAPRFSRTRPEIRNSPPLPGKDTEAVLLDFDFSPAEIEKLKTDEVI